VGTAIAGASPLLLLGYAAVQARAVLGARVGGSLAQLVGPHGRVAGFARSELDGAVDTFVQAPDYAGNTGFLYLVQTDLARVLALVAKPERPLVVFVDDLDRCSPSTVVQVIEAVNLFLAGELENTIFVIAMEPEMVVAHIEAAYDDLVAKVRERMGESAVDGELGWRFLEKFVQLPLTLPGIDPTGLATFFESLFPNAPAVQPDSEATRPQPEAAVTASSSAGDRDVVGMVVPPPAASAASREALRRFVDTRLMRDSDEIKALIGYATRYLTPPNPREIKRFVNLFRFFVMIHTERVIATLPTAGSLDQLAKLALASTRWPSLMVALAAEVEPGSEQTVFELLEQPPDATRKKGESAAAAGLRALTEALGACGLSDATVARLVAADVREFMASAPIVGEPARIYL